MRKLLAMMLALTMMLTLVGAASAESDYTIRIYTGSPYAPFLRSVVDVPIASKAYYESVDEETFAQSPIGCGAYKLASHSEGDSIKLEAFADYYGGAPAIQDVTFKIIADMAAMSVGLQAGQIDFAEIDASVLSTLEAAEGVSIATADSTTFAFIAMNTEVEPYSNPTFRQAINYAIDREALIQAYAEGYGVANSNLLTPEREGYSESQKQYTYDPDKAVELLAECGYADGFDAGTFIVAESYKLMAQIIQSDLEKVGITCQLEILEFNAYLDKLMDGDFTMTCLQMTLEGDTQQMSLALMADFIGMANNARWPTSGWKPCSTRRWRPWMRKSARPSMRKSSPSCRTKPFTVSCSIPPCSMPTRMA